MTEEELKEAELVAGHLREENWGHSAKVVESLVAEVRRIDGELVNEKLFNEGWQDHVGDLLDAMKPFAYLVNETSGRIPVERLSLMHWHSLSKAFGKATSALSLERGGEAAHAKAGGEG